MAFTYGFYNSVNHDRKYDAVQMGQIFDGIITDGIYATYLKAMVVKASSNASEVIVQPGRAWFNHTWSYNDADFPVAAPEPEVVLDRIDTLVLDINSEDASRTNSFLWVQGTPTSQIPEPPTLIHTVTHNQYPLCDVYRQAGTTQIYAADITNRVGTSDCPFVTGVLEGIDIDDLLAQWDDEFHTWENATKASFEGWMVNQQAVYTAWWDALKAQMADDVADVEAWIETIHDILDEEVATRLQAEIDEIKTELPSGSHITVTTSDSELYSRTVTITDEANHTVTSQFDATGVAVFKTVPYVGNLTISSTDGTRTATAVVQTPYFARYEFELAFWNATVNIIGDSELGGETVTIEDSSEALVGTVVLNASGLGIFNATYPDTYKFSVTHGGETMSVTLEVSQETTYNVEIYSGFDFKRWVTLGGLDADDYDSLSEVFADEAAVRRLMLVHASADYLVAGVTAKLSTIDDFCTNDTAMKWIGLCDYVCDGLRAITGVEAKFLASQYWERYLKDHVPTMTSNTAPYGNAIYSSQNSQYPAYQAFDGKDSTQWATNATNAGTIGYKFTNPICVKKVRVKGRTSHTTIYKIQASNDNSTWVDLTDERSVADLDESITLNNNDYYLYYRLSGRLLDSSSYIGIYTLQFYGRALNVSVPTMTSNTAPYGIVSASSTRSSYEPYKAFDGDASTMWGDDNEAIGQVAYIQYVFTNPICVKQVFLNPNQTTITERADYVQIFGSNDGVNWSNALNIDQTTMSVPVTRELNNDNAYLYYRVAMKKKLASHVYFKDIQFYGLDYSEKEFEAGITKKWLYDHGVELSTLNSYVSSANATAEKQDNNLYLAKTSANNLNASFTVNDSIDFTAYDHAFVIVGDISYPLSLSSGSKSMQITTAASPSSPGTSLAGTALFSKINHLDIASVDQAGYFRLLVSNGSSGGVAMGVTIEEVWLE